MSFDATAAAGSVRRDLHSMFRKRLKCTVFTALLLAATCSGALAQELPKYLNADETRTNDLEAAAKSWRTTEFNNTLVLGKLLAEYAYAFGARGQNAKIGVMDGGLWTGHDEFKDQRINNIHSEGKFEITLQTLGETPFVKAGETFSVDGIYYGPTNLVPSTDAHPNMTAGTILARRNGVNANNKGTHGIAFASTIYVAQSGELIYNDEQGSLDNNVVESKEKDPEMFRQSMNGFIKEGVQVVLGEWQLAPRPGFDKRDRTTQMGTVADLVMQYDGGKGGHC